MQVCHRKRLPRLLRTDPYNGHRWTEPGALILVCTLSPDFQATWLTMASWGFLYTWRCASTKLIDPLEEISPRFTIFHACTAHKEHHTRIWTALKRLLLYPAEHLSAHSQWFRNYVFGLWVVNFTAATSLGSRIMRTVWYSFFKVDIGIILQMSNM